MKIKGKKGGLFGFIFGILGVVVFMVALTLILILVYLGIVYGFPVLKEAINQIASKGS